MNSIQVEAFDECEFFIRKGFFGLTPVHPHQLVVAYLEAVREGQSVVDGYEFVVRFGLFGAT